MNPANVVTFNKSGEIYIGKKATELLEISDCSSMKILTDGEDITIRLFKAHLHDDEHADHNICLYSKSGGVRGSCKEFTNKLQFGDANTISLEFISKRINNGVEMRIKKPLPITMPANSQGEAGKSQSSTTVQEQEEKAEAKEALTVKDRQADICREIRRYKNCNDISCNGTGGKFAGTECPLFGDGGCENAEKWLIDNGYPLEPEKGLGTVSNPITEKQLDIFSLQSKSASAPQTRPLPDRLPEWLRGPLSRGEHVRVFMRNGETGWALGAHVDSILKSGRPFVVVLLDSDEESGMIDSYVIEAIKAFPPRLKPAVECLAVAKEQKISLSSMQISAIVNGGVPPEGHGLPDEMFE